MTRSDLIERLARPQVDMNRELRVLMLEDTPNDAELAGRELHKAGIAFTSIRVETRDAFIRALEEFRPDIILSDYKLPDFDGMTALEIVLRDHPEVPVIMVTGVLTDIEAVEFIHAGARDYILKERLARLGPAVQRTLVAEQDNRARKRAEIIAERERIRLQTILKTASDGIHILDCDGVLVEANDAFLSMLGFDQSAIGKLRITDWTAQMSWTNINARIDDPISTKHGKVVFETRYRRSDGVVLDVEISAARIEIEGKSYICAASRDITERKRAERALIESEERFKLFMDTLPAAVFLKNEEGAYIYVNRYVADNIGEGDWIGKSDRDNFPPGLAEKIRADDLRALEAGFVVTEEKIPGADGQTRLLETRKFRITRQGQPPLLGGITLDFTEQRRNAEQYRSVIQASLDGYWVTDTSGRILEVNDSICRMHGYSRDELLRMSISDIEADETLEETAVHIREMIEKGHVQFESRHKRKDGTIANVEVSILRVATLGERFFAFIRDITERKQVETELRIAATAFESQEGITVTDANGTILKVNHAFTYITGYTADDAIGKNQRLLKSDRHDAAFYTTMWETLLQQGAWQGEIMNRRKNGEIFPGHLTITSVKDLNGAVTNYVAALSDITERKLAETTEALLRSYEQREIVQTSLDGFYVVNAKDARIIEVNSAFCSMVGYAQKELLTMRISDLEADESSAETAARMKKIMANGYDRFEARHRHKQGHLVSLEASVSYSKLDGDKFFTFVRDITEHKLAEKNLRESENRFRTLFESATDSMYILDMKGRIIDINRTGYKRLGYEEQELLGRRIAEFDTPECAASAPKHMAKLLKEGTVLFEAAHVCKDGTAMPVEVNARIIHLDGEQRLFSVVRDITERKKAEQTQKKLTRALKLLSECGTLLIYAKNEQELLEKICQLAVVTGGYLMAMVGFAENDEAKTVRPIAQSGYEEGYLDSIKITWSDTKLGQGPAGTAIRTKAASQIMDCLTDPKMVPWREAATKRGYRSSIGLPLISNNQVLGALTIYSAEPHAFRDEEVALLQELADNISFGIGTLRTRIAQERAELESRRLSKHLLTVREEEKANVAREIHDDLGSTLAALKIEIQMLNNRLSAEQKKIPQFARVELIAGLLDNTMKATRRIITDLRPTILDDYGLLDALKWHADEFHKRTGIECRVACIHSEDKNCKGCKECEYELDKVLSINLFRIFQESLTNVARHSGASRVEAEFRPDGNEVVLSISDNGRGLPEGHTIAPTSFGIRGMHERVGQLGGKIEIDSPPGGGLNVTVILPLSAASQ